jgi:tryptophan synthase alpha chain
MSSRLRESIEAGRKAKGLAFLPFLPGGYPDIATFIETLKLIAAAGADVVEIGFPFSDPIADGPTIQAAFAETLRRGITTADVLSAVREARKTIATPLVAMVSYSIVFRYGVDRFSCDAQAAGFDGILIPDLSPPEAQAVCSKIRAKNLDTVLLVAPTTSPARRREIADLCSGFVYYLSISGITGERDALPANLAANVGELKAMSPVPVCVGFGISKPSHLKQLSGVADGAIVGSAIVKVMQQHAGRPTGDVAGAVATYCREMTYGVRCQA